uniref:Uncharacterized protein n=1 Tax=Anguilla anguilla TaxID=7936 RepID=A0A0E9SNR4_ANGAN
MFLVCIFPCRTVCAMRNSCNSSFSQACVSSSMLPFSLSHSDDLGSCVVTEVA